MSLTRRVTSASDDKEKCDNGREGDVAGEMGNANGASGRWSVIGIWKGKGGKVVTELDLGKVCGREQHHIFIVILPLVNTKGSG